MNAHESTSNLTIANAPLPATYEAAKKALAVCSSMDECADWANKAQAMASYARMAKDETLRNTADRIRSRAVRRLGELLKQYDARGDHMKSGGAPTSQREAASQAGVSKDQQVQAVRVANVPKETFEAAVEATRPAKVGQLAELGKVSQTKHSTDSAAVAAISALNRVIEFCEMNSPEYVAAAIDPLQVPAMRKKIGQVDAWFDHFVVNLQD